MYKLMESTPTRTRYRVLSSTEVDRLANAIAGKRGVQKKVTVPVVELKKEEVPTVEPEVIEPEEVTPQVEPEVAVPEAEAPVEVVEQEPEVQETEETAEVAEEPVEESTPLSVLGISATNEKNLKSNNINSVEELSAFLASGATLESLPKFGTKSETAVLEAFNKWQTEQKS